MRKKIYNYISILTLLFLVNACEDSIELDPIDYVSFQTATLDFGVEIGGQTTQAINVYASSISNTDRVFTISVEPEGTTADEASYVIPTTVTIPSGTNEGTFDITFFDSNIEGKTAELKLSSEGDTFFGANMVIELSQKCPDGTTRLGLAITFDDWPEEIYWRITSGGTVVVQSADPPAFGAYAGLTGTLELKWCLVSGDYSFEIIDAFGDGAGPFVIELAGQELYSNDGAYGGGTSFDFSIP